MPSLEILAAPGVAVPESMDPSITILKSAPPVSHRSPSRFQSRFEAIGGILYHFGRERNGWFDASDIMEFIDDDCGRFKLMDTSRDAILGLVTKLVAETRRGVILTCDYQFGPSNSTELEISLAKLREMHDSAGLPVNCFISVLA